MPRLNLPKEQTYVGPALIWKRVVAFLIDMFIVNLFIFMPFRGLFSDSLPNYSFSEVFQMASSDETVKITTIAFAMSVFAMLYFVMLERKMGQTIGKHLMKIHVQSDKEELKTWQIYVRNMFFLPVFPFIVLWLLDPLFMLFNKSNQRLSEILSKTKVVANYSMQREW